MGREIKRVPIDFDHPINKVWSGFLMPNNIVPNVCPNENCSENCKVCNNDGYVFESKEQEAAYNNWEETEPPTGEGYQVWETVSEGSPISPVFKNEDEMKAWLMALGKYTEAGIDAFIKSGWVMSGMLVGGIYYKDIDSAAV